MIFRMVVLLLVCAITGCEKVIDVKYNDSQSVVAISGTVSGDRGPHTVKIARSLGISDTSAYPTINDAIVTITDNVGQRESLVFQGKGLYSTDRLVGIEGRTYTLTVSIGSESYSATSTMQPLVNLDSIKFDKFIFGGDTEINVIPVFSDPPGKGNKYRFVLNVNGKQINQQFVLNDQIRDGVINTQRLEVNDNIVKIKLGDIVRLEMQCIDSAVSIYYTTLALLGDSGPGGGPTPNNPATNVSNGALGVFSAHKSGTKQAVVN